MRHLGFEIMLDVDIDRPITEEERVVVAERIGIALQNWAEASESGYVGEFTCGVTIRDLDGKHLATVKW